MKLWYHADSDSLYWRDDWDGVSEDVTDNPTARMNAKLRGMKRPEFFDAVPPVEVTSAPHTMATAVRKGYERWDRKPADLYPTPVDGTESLMPVLNALMKSHGNRVWEPACGDGRMSRVLEWHGYDVHSTDLRPHSGYGKAYTDRETIDGGLDFINDDPEKKWGWTPEVDWVITNPPFSHAEQFILRALSFTPNVAMLLKQTYWNAASRLPLFDNHRPKLVLPCTWRLAFLEDERGKSPLMDCCWVVWFDDPKDDGEVCAFEPMPRLKYPGYAKKGTLAVLDILAGAFADLGDSYSGLVDGHREAELLAYGSEELWNGTTTA